MRHRISGKQLSRSTSHRRALRRNMAASLIEHGAIRTTLAKAKELRPFIENLITIARRGTLHSRRRVISILQDRQIYTYNEKEREHLPEDLTVVQKLFSEVAPRYVDRPGGYTRIIRLSDRRIGDGGQQVVLQLVEETSSAAAEETDRATSRRKRRAAKRRQAGSVASPEPAAQAAQTAEDDAQAESSDEQEAQDDSQ